MAFRVSNDDFSFSIDQCRKHQLLGDGTNEIYEKLELLRDMRNRVYIQNRRNLLERRERDAFTEDRQTCAQYCVEYVLKHLEEHYSRRGPDYVGGLELPWNPLV